ncbi:MAG TPA: NAD(P)-dependent alcohol dehydrogenase [Jiangellaceae bacterium]
MAGQPNTTTTMKAIVQDTYGAPDVLVMRDVPRPQPGDGELLVRIHAAGVDAGVWHLTAGMPYFVRLMGFGLRRPKVAVRGMDFAGRVEAVGTNVTGFAIGDEVYGTCDGSFAEYAVADPQRVAHAPANLTPEQAATVPVSGVTALKAVRQAGQVQPGQRVLVTGAGGGVGTYAVQLAKHFGGRVTGVCSTAKTDLVRSIGADEVIDHTNADFTSTGQRYDVIIDTAGRRRLSHLRRALAPEGTLVIVGGEGGGRLFGGFDRTLRAALLSRFVKQRLRALISTERTADLKTLAELIEAGAVTPAIDRTFPLSEAARAVQYLHDGRALGKLVVTV